MMDSFRRKSNAFIIGDKDATDLEEEMKEQENEDDSDS
jgi:hypothetical protein